MELLLPELADRKRLGGRRSNRVGIGEEHSWEKVLVWVEMWTVECTRMNRSWEVEGHTLKHTIAYINRREKIRLSFFSFHIVQYCLYYKRGEKPVDKESRGGRRRRGRRGDWSWWGRWPRRWWTGASQRSPEIQILRIDEAAGWLLKVSGYNDITE